MAFPKLKLCWNGSRVEAEWHLGLFGVYTRGGAGGRLRGIVFSGRGLLAWSAGLAAAAYFAGAATLWFWLDRRPYNYVTYADLVLPARWGGIEKLRGRALVAEGMDDLKARRWGEGLQKLRLGVIRNPDEIEGRLALAEIFTAMKARKQAVEIYDGGLATRYPGRNYIEAMLKSAAQSENHGWSLRTCDRALALAAADPALKDERGWLVRQKLSALLAADRADEALALAEAEGETGSAVIGEFRVLALLKAGRTAEAVAYLQEWSGRLGGRPDAQVLRLQVRALREAGDLDGMEKALESLRVLSPTDPRPYVYGIVQRVLAGRREEAGRALDQFFLRFGSSSQSLLLLAAPLVEIKESGLLGRVTDHAAQQGFDLEPFRRFQVQVLIARGEWRAAGAMLAQVGESKRDETAVWHAIMNAQIQAALDPADGAQSNLVSLVRGRQFALGFYKELIANMRSAGRAATARELITFAQGVYPQNTEIDGWRKELDAELATAARLAEPVVAPSRPATAVAETPAPPATVRAELSEADFTSRLGELTKAGDYAGALRHIREARLAKPAWLGARDAELLRDELRFNGRVGDLLSLRAAARLFINGDRPRSVQAVEIARELHTAGHKDEAVLLLKELLVKSPDFPVASRLLAEWSPAPAATKQ